MAAGESIQNVPPHEDAVEDPLGSQPETFDEEENVVELGADETPAACKTTTDTASGNVEIQPEDSGMGFVEIDLERVHDEPEDAVAKPIGSPHDALTVKQVLIELMLWLLMGVLVAVILVAIQALASNKKIGNVIKNDPALLVAPILIMLLVGVMGMCCKRRHAHSVMGSIRDAESTHNSASSGHADSASSVRSID